MVSHRLPLNHSVSVSTSMAMPFKTSSAPRTLPGASDDELERFIKENLEKQAPLIALMTTRDQSLAPAPANETESQRNGRQGPEVRDSNNED